MKSKLNGLYQIFLSQNPQNYRHLTRIDLIMKNCYSEMYQFESDDPVYATKQVDKQQLCCQDYI